MVPWRSFGHIFPKSLPPQSPQNGQQWRREAAGVVWGRKHPPTSRWWGVATRATSGATLANTTLGGCLGCWAFSRFFQGFSWFSGCPEAPPAGQAAKLFRSLPRVLENTADGFAEVRRVFGGAASAARSSAQLPVWAGVTGGSLAPPLGLPGRCLSPLPTCHPLPPDQGSTAG